MKAIIVEKYGSPDSLKLRDFVKPIPNDDEVLVKIHAASVNAGDWHLLRGDPFLVRLMFGLFKPKFKILGSDIAGVVDSVGSNIKEFKPGDEVFGDLSESGFGAFAEFVSAPESALVKKPKNVSFEEAAAVPVAAITALQALRNKGKIKSGDKILINGASGGVGTYAVQIAKSFGTEVTGVCSTSKMEMVNSIGADHVIDYTKEDFTKSGLKYDIILAANGYYPISVYKRALNPRGIYVMTGGTMKQMFEAMIKGPCLSKKEGQQLGNLLSKPTKDDLLYLKELLEAGKIKPVIDKRYSLNEIPDAVKYVEEGHAKGKVVICVAGEK